MPDPDVIRKHAERVASATQNGTTNLHHVELRPAASYGREKVKWLPGQEGFIPLGMLSILVGYQGDGKTLLCCNWAAACIAKRIPARAQSRDRNDRGRDRERDAAEARSGRRGSQPRQLRGTQEPGRQRRCATAA